MRAFLAKPPTIPYSAFSGFSVFSFSYNLRYKRTQVLCLLLFLFSRPLCSGHSPMLSVWVHHHAAPQRHWRIWSQATHTHGWHAEPIRAVKSHTDSLLTFGYCKYSTDENLCVLLCCKHVREACEDMSSLCPLQTAWSRRKRITKQASSFCP